MKLFSEEVKHTSTNSNHNILKVENFSEIFFDIFEIEINKSKYPVEKISIYENSPVVSVPVLVDGVEIFYPFVLVKGKFDVIFNEKNTLDKLYPDKNLDIVKEKTSKEIENDDVIEESLNEIQFQEEEFTVRKNQILEQIKKAKQEARKALLIERKRILENTSKNVKKKNKLLKATLDEAKDTLISEFVDISNKLKKELLENSTNSYDELSETLKNKLNTISDDLRLELESNFNNSSNIFDSKIKELVKELYSNTVYPKLEKDLNEIAFQIVEKVGEIENDLNSKLDEKLDKAVMVTVNTNLTSKLENIQKANIELNDNINKGVNKALSRAGNVKSLVEKLDKEINEKIESELSNIEKYFDERIINIQEKTFDVTEESRKYIIDLVNKSKMDLLEEIKKIPKEKPVEYILESKKKDPEKVNLDKLRKEYDSIIHNKFENYKTDLRKYIAVYSGGGSVAQQFADGGVMNGNLTVVGAISASQYLGLSGGSGGGPSTDTLDDVTSRGNVTNNSISVDTLSSNKVKFNTSSSDVAGVGELVWNDVDGTVDIGLKGGNVKNQLGQEINKLIVNKTGSDLLESEYKVVRARNVSEGGAQGQRLAVVLALGDGSHNHHDNVIGVVTENILDNQEGFITLIGNINKINTTGALQGESWSDGDILYLSPSVPGGLTNIKPTHPNHSVIIGRVAYTHSTNGKIDVKVVDTPELEDLHGVSINNPLSSQYLSYDSVSGAWINKHIVSSDISDAQSYADPNKLAAFGSNGEMTFPLNGPANISFDNVSIGSLNSDALFGQKTDYGWYLKVPSLSSEVFWYLPQQSGIIALTSQSDGSIGMSDVSNLVNTLSGKQNELSTIAGNVGVGISTPSYKLDVNGDIRSVGDTFVNGSIVVGGDMIISFGNIYGLARNMSDHTVVKKSSDETLVKSDVLIDDGSKNLLVTGTASDDYIYLPENHNLTTNQYVRFTSITGGSGLNTTTNYFVRDLNNTLNICKLSTTVGGAAVNFTTNITNGTLVKYGRREVAIFANIDNTDNTNPSTITNGIHLTEGGGLYVGRYANGATTGRNVRGLGAIDFSYGGSAEQCATGNYSFQAASQGVNTSGSNSFAIGCSTGNQSASGPNSGIISCDWTNGIGGTQNVAIACSFAGASSSSGYNVLLGGNSQVTGNSSRNVAIGNCSINGRNYGFFHGAVDFDGQRNTQKYAIQATGKTTDGTTLVELLFTNAKFFIESGKTYSGIINVQGYESNGLKTAHYIRQYSISSMLRTVSSVNTTNEEITFTRDHNFNVGDAVLYSGNIGGLTTGTTYFVVQVVDSTTIKIGLTSGGSVINLTSTGSGTRTFSFTRLNYAPVIIGNDYASGTTFNISVDGSNMILHVTGVTGEIWRWQAYVEGVEMLQGI